MALTLESAAARPAWRPVRAASGYLRRARKIAQSKGLVQGRLTAARERLGIAPRARGRGLPRACGRELKGRPGVRPLRRIALHIPAVLPGDRRIWHNDRSSTAPSNGLVQGRLTAARGRWIIATTPSASRIAQAATAFLPPAEAPWRPGNAAPMPSCEVESISTIISFRLPKRREGEAEAAEKRICGHRGKAATYRLTTKQAVEHVL